MGDNDSRKQGVEFGSLESELESHDYPASKEELVGEYGDEELDLSGETRTFEEVLEGYDPDEEFESAEGVQDAVMNMVGSEAVGRQRYSDRALDQDEEEQESL